MIKPKRKPLSKKLRFEIFKRDRFMCQYCGKAPPEATLEVDHITPVVKGGENNEDNLITACFDCNRGKGANSLDSVPSSLIERSEQSKELEDQLKEIKKINKRIKSRVTRDVNSIEKVFGSYFDDRCFTEIFKASIRNNFLPKLDVSTLENNMEIACGRVDASDKAIKYFCGICWNMIKDADNAD